MGDFDLRDNDTVSDIFKSVKQITRRCKVCRKRFHNVETFRTHVSFHKKMKKVLNTEPRAYLCRVCSTSHNGLQSFVEHQKVHQARFVANDFLSIEDNSSTLAIPTGGHAPGGGEQVLLRTPNGDLQLAIISSNGQMKDAAGVTISPGKYTFSSST